MEIVYVFSRVRHYTRELERLRGLNLLRQAAIQGCRFGGLNSSLLPHPYLADYLEVTDPEESDLWRARNILHCGASVHGLRTRITTKNATPVQFATEGLAWQLLAKPDIAFESQRKNWPHADYIAAGQRAERLRRAVQESEKDFPPTAAGTLSSGFTLPRSQESRTTFIKPFLIFLGPAFPYF
jgi:hypothetical protein